jgi:flagellar FliL protein
MAEKAKEPATAGKAGGGRGKLLAILLVGLVVMLGAGGAGAYFMGLFDGGAPASAGEAADAGHDPDSAHAEAAGGGGGHGAGTDVVQAAGPKVIFVDLPDVLVNLSSDSRRMRFLKLRLAVEVSSQGVADTVTQLTPRIMDSFQLYLRGLTVDDLGGPSALHRLKQEMLARINLALEPSRIEDVLFKEMLVQ